MTWSPNDVLTFTQHLTVIAEGHAAHEADGPHYDLLDLVGTPPPPKQVVLRDDGWFDGPGVVRVPTQRVQRLAYIARGASRRPTYLPHVEGAVWHWTDTPRGTGLVIARNTVHAPGTRSSHGLIDGDGTFYQLAPLTTGTWHAGGPSARRWRWDAAGCKWSVDPSGQSTWTANSVFAGFELVNVGEVRYVQGRGWLGWPFGDAAKEAASGRSALVAAPEAPPPGDVVPWQGWDGRVRHYHAFTAAQVATATAIVRAMRRDLGLPAESFLHGHHECDPDRRDDPGRMWHEGHLPQVVDGSTP